MSKLGLCVRYDCNNYGSMLQIVATQNIIKKMGWEYELIRYDKNTIPFYLKNITRIFNPYFVQGKVSALKKKIEMQSYPEIMSKNAERISRFKSFRKKYLGPYSQIYKGYNSLKKGANNYDAVMVGSDQLWTPAGIKSRFYNLLFVPDNIKKISLATSFGVTEVPKNQTKLTTEYLNRIDFLSLRENSGAKIVKKLTGRDVLVALDPTLLFSAQEWLDIFSQKEVTKGPYIFAYFLGINTDHREAVNKLSHETGIKIVTCPHLDEFVKSDLDFGDEQLFDIDPVDFLNLIRGAEYICTDSFHGSVFSIVNHKKFVTFDRYSDSLRKSKNNRISSLFNRLGLQDRNISLDQENRSLYSLLEEDIDYDQVDKSLELLREDTMNFLQKALEA